LIYHFSPPLLDSGNYAKTFYLRAFQHVSVFNTCSYFHESKTQRPQKYTDFFKFPLACLETKLIFRDRKTKMLLTCPCFCCYSRTGPKKCCWK